MEKEDERVRLLGQRETPHEPHDCRGKGEMFNSLQGKRHKSKFIQLRMRAGSVPFDFKHQLNLGL